MIGQFSVKKMVDDYALTTDRGWETDRLNTVGASEIGQCLRKTWFAKNETPRDPGYVDRYGARRRGNLIEDHWVVPALQHGTAKSRTNLLFAGKDQRTLADGYLSATSDGLITGAPRNCLSWIGVPDIGSDCFVVEIKSIDPRVDLRVEKPEHSFQTQAQMGLIRHATEYRPNYALISYVDASFLDDVKEFVVAFDERIYEAAQFRAARVMTTTDPLRLQPEGKMAGGDECAWCAWKSHCANVTVAGIPHEDGPKLGDNAAAELMRLRDTERDLAAQEDATVAEHAEAREAIKEFLRTNGIRRYSGDGWSVSWSSVKGKTTIDLKEVEAAGIDLSEYEKTGNPSERLTIK